ncbi:MULTISPECIES: sugar O-acetyltransferase [unclassified Rhizobium]|jgi:acetyltransferase-like isoleucine patch superfamily enzyme|uniref:sugar O-acetyltransferase n=1 Tax=unclassified Rhizobium TaxID=2613769 RepID=UPI001A9A10CE|nr:MULTISPECIES: sugar O-acetyltransferase [unclassified Rhizobium]MBX5165264.1 sugar O-acetyltransferase [Rhizobium sp. NZLR4b]MBX5172664.1 sugar O-acetyltransferase [Rhizobium sp. NZLR1b]MBX5185068.1 sugar O-acetyltransferase [Rhizobium sp. NZLR5]MBX5191136.1 sugar O-acetyltransferase [Rhizobium sp. NZLR3b]MBX5197615.1 sugar O-acetyltransferase [Rhizobium sp. NZLR10]
MTSSARSAEGRARFENVQRAVRLSARLSAIGFDDLPGLRSAFEELVGKPVGDRFMVIPPFSTDCGLNISVGANVFINQGCHFMDMGGIAIGDDVMIGPKVTIVSAGHPVSPSKRRNGITAAPVIIGKNVWIGAAATILQGVTIGENAVIAAGAVVSRSVPANSMVAGVPARVIKHL